MKLFIEINVRADDIKIHSRGNKRIQGVIEKPLSAAREKAASNYLGILKNPEVHILDIAKLLVVSKRQFRNDKPPARRIKRKAASFEACGFSLCKLKQP